MDEEESEIYGKAIPIDEFEGRFFSARPRSPFDKWPVWLVGFAQVACFAVITVPTNLGFTLRGMVST